MSIFFLDGFLQALLLLILPWTAAVWLSRKFRWSAKLYFPAAGALLLFVIGCAAASISPKPLFIEDQTFLEGALIAAQRQGLCFLFSGAVFGAAYWFISERGNHATPRTAS